MADGFDIHLNEEQAQRLKAAAEASGVDAQAFALQVLEQAMEPSPAWMVREDAARWAEYERTGISIPAEEAMAEFRRVLSEKLAAR